MSSFLSTWEAEKRLQFANLHSNTSWKNVIFSGMTSFSLHTAGHIFRGTRPRKSVNKTKATISVWAWFSSAGAGSIVLLNHLSEKQFHELLGEVLIPQVTARFGTDPVVVIDTSASGNAFSTSVYDNLKEIGNGLSVKEMKWPPKSSHLSPFDVIWSNIESSIRMQRGQPKNAEELWDYVELIWERRIERPLFREGLVDHLKVKLQSIVAADGELTEVEKE